MVVECARAITERIIGAAMTVHRELGPGLLESAYRACLVYELGRRGLRAEQEVRLPVRYKGIDLRLGYRLDLLVEDQIIIELKAVKALSPIHEAQLLTYLKLAEREVGLLLNFNVPLLKHGIRRLIMTR